MSGRIKWFDPAKGFGFILDPAGGPDVLLHANVLRNYGQGTVAEGTQIRVRVVPTARGTQACEVLALDVGTAAGPPPVADLAGCDVSALGALPVLPARVKWFDRAKGFGFATIFGRPGDVFLHVEVLRHSGLGDLGPGEAIAIRVLDGRRGPMAAQILPWDRALALTATAPIPLAAARSAPAPLAGEADPEPLPLAAVAAG